SPEAVMLYPTRCRGFQAAGLKPGAAAPGSS
ncbi:MAG: hypothetical protein RLZZ220_1182, partial [Pseudomonadota bacterium]